MASSAKDIQLRELMDTVSQLKTMMAEQTELIRSLRTVIDEKTAHEAVLQEQVDYLTKKLFGTSSEKTHSDIPGHADVNGDPVEISVNPDGATAALVFKTVADPFVGKVSYIKVISGKVAPDSQLVNMRTGNTERIGKVVVMRGKKQEDVSAITAGDIGAVLKLSGVNTGDTLCAPTRKVVLDGVSYPNPTLSMAIAPKTKGEEDNL